MSSRLPCFGGRVLLNLAAGGRLSRKISKASASGLDFLGTGTIEGVVDFSSGGVPCNCFWMAAVASPIRFSRISPIADFINRPNFILKPPHMRSVIPRIALETCARLGSSTPRVGAGGIAPREPPTPASVVSSALRISIGCDSRENDIVLPISNVSQRNGRRVPILSAGRFNRKM